MSKVTFNSVIKDNEALAGEIQAFVSKQPSPVERQEVAQIDYENDEQEQQLKLLIRKLYSSICDFRVFRGPAATPDKKIIAAWKSFLVPIQALTHVRPDGQMIAARMILYLAGAFSLNSQLPQALPRSTTSQNLIDLCFGLLIALDDALLECLKSLWDRSHHRGTFRWVFTHHPVKKAEYHVDCRCQILPEEVKGNPEATRKWIDQRNNDRCDAACLTRLRDLTAANGVRGGYIWRRPDGDTTKHQRDPDATQWAFRAEGPEGTERLLDWQYIGSDGPIRDDYRYDIIIPDIRPTQYDLRSRQLLRRSRQFVLDVRRIAVVNLLGDRRVATQCALARRLPVELQEYVLEYLGVSKLQEHRYLSKFDLSSAYSPFPDISKTQCDQCSAKTGRATNKMARSTCPLKSITVWSMPLRAFHTLHMIEPRVWGLCEHENCTGHHSDNSWHLKKGLGKYLDRMASYKCQSAVELEGIGLGPLRGERLVPKNDENWRKRFPVRWMDPAHDVAEETSWIDCRGLARVMRFPQNTRLTSLPSGRAPWMFGRTRGEESIAISAISEVEI